MATPSGFRLRPWRVLAVAAVLGIGVGLYLSRQADLEEHLALAHMEKVSEDLPPMRFPAPPKPQGSGAPIFNGRAVEGLPPYPGAVPANLLSQQPGVGGELQVAWFMTDDPPESVISFYAKDFASKGLPFASHFYSDAAGYVGYAEPDGERFHMLLAIKQGQQTVVFPSSSYPRKLLDSLQNKLPPEVPELPGTSSSMVFDFDEKSLAQKSFVATVQGKSVEEILKWYEESFKSRGWVVAPPDRNELGEATLEASLAPRRASLTIKPDKASVTVFLTLSG